MSLGCREFPFGSSEYLASVALREEILRKPLGLEWQLEDFQGEEASHHLGCFLGDDPFTIKMRQVAVAADIQRQGAGTALVCFGEQFAHDAGYQSIVAHARVSALPFYKRLGYTIDGPQFIEVSIPHFRISKPLV